MDYDRPKDLASHSPRQPGEKFHGYDLLLRTIDKCRAALTGKSSGYEFGCPVDHLLFAFKGIESADFQTKVESAATDEDIAVWFEQAGNFRSDAEISRWNAEIENYRPFTNSRLQDWFTGKCVRLGLDPAQTTLFQYLEAEDRHR